ncbi:MAG: pyruvate dehydrogenase (acetyl-transferring) E1 component subunit alpha [Verrucomicrobia bacterium]|nr:pyruvate dehydrogenase (acetyl-transferring) E1 component subunit alpha [Verrucomicrobiota bacterium]
MLEIRGFEDKVYELLGRNVIKGASHLYAGQEAVAVGACSVLEPDDVITSTHRGHGHCIAKGGQLPQMMAELCGKSTGYSRGRGGSMHIADVAKGNLGATGIVGGNIPVATGAGLAIKMRGERRVVLCFFGDGACNNGVFHESLNMAGLWRLPVVYIIENNLYGMSVSTKRACAVSSIGDRASGYAMTGATVDGQDLLAVREAVAEAVERARRGEGPTLIEAQTYRYYGHSRSDPRKYRTREEEDHYRNEHDPIELFKRHLVEKKIASPDEIATLEKGVADAVEAATEYALNSPYPDASELYDFLYVE